MSTYRAPVTDMLFTLLTQAGLSELLEHSDYADLDLDLIGAVLREAGHFFAEELAPTNRAADVAGLRFEDGHVLMPECMVKAYRALVEQGWTAFSYSEAEGGHGLPAPVVCAITEMMQSANLAFSMCPLLLPAAVSTLQTHASADLAARYVPKLVSGEWTATMALTEPQAGSDLSLVRTRAVPDGDRYLISGQKIFISFADHNFTNNIVHLVLARLPDAPEGLGGISLFVVPKYLSDANGCLGEQNDIVIAGIEHKMGLHASPTCTVSLGDNGGATGYLVGEPNQGLAYMFTMMNHARLQVGSQAVALSELAYQQAVAYAKERKQGRLGGSHDTVEIIQHADVRRMLMTMKAGTLAMRGLIYSTATMLDGLHRLHNDADKADSKARAELLTPIVKGWTTELLQELVGLGVQVHGGMGFVEETGVAQLVRDARITTIYEGTTAIQAQDLVKRKVLKDQGKVIRRWLLDMRTMLQCVSPTLALEACKLGQALDDADSTLKLLLGHDHRSLQLGVLAYDFMMMCGYVAGAYQLLVGANAYLQINVANVSAEYGAQYLQAARFYMLHLLPRAQTHNVIARGAIEYPSGLSVESFAEL